VIIPEISVGDELYNELNLVVGKAVSFLPVTNSGVPSNRMLASRFAE